MEENCDEFFLEKVKSDWEILTKIDACSFPRLLAMAERCKSLSRIESENKWLRERIDSLSSAEGVR